MTTNGSSGQLPAAEVIRRYKDEELPAFVEIDLQDINQVGNFDERPLHVASGRGNIGEVTALISAGADVNAPGDMGCTPLHEAVRKGNVEVIKLLLYNRPSTNVKNEFVHTPLDIAKRKERDDIVDLLQNSITDGT